MVVEFRILGPVEVRAGDRALPAGEPQRLTVLAALMVDMGRVVGLDALIDRVWGDEPPQQAVSSVRAHITRIRRMLEQASSGGESVEVVRQAGGYVMTARPEQVDLFRFEALVDRAREADSVEQRVELLRAALGLWRGEPLAGIGGDWAARTRERLVQARLGAMVMWAEAEIGVGEAARVVAELGDLAAAHPLMEPLVTAYLRALVAAGRPNEALERCRLHRERLVEEFGTEQSPQLRALYEEILRADDEQATEGPRAVPEPRAAEPRAAEPRAAEDRRTEEDGRQVRGSGVVEVSAPAAAPAPAQGRAGGRAAGRRRLWAMVGAAALVTIAGGAVRAWPTMFAQAPDSVSTTGAATGPAAAGHARGGSSGPSSASAEGGPWVAVSDFTGDAAVDRQWNAMAGSRANGSSWALSMVRFDGGELRLLGVGRNPSGQGNQAGAACWCSRARQAPIRTYGVWEARAKFDVGSGYGVIAGLWPSDNIGPFITLMRSDDGERRSIYPEFGDVTTRRVLQGPVLAGDFTDWNTYTVEWRKDFVTLAVNGRVFLDTRTFRLSVAIPQRPMHFYVQMVSGPDGSVPGPGADTPSTVAAHVDWVRYRP